ncbi:MAG: hypothetical protein MJ252_02480 [archaeon]|nr:hypothetical protein [archaeon]
MNGNIPEPRKGHAMLYYQNYFILYGGETEKGITDDNFYKFQLDTNTWSILKVSGLSPSPRAYHSMDFFKKDSIIIYGGKLQKKNNKTKYEITDSLILFDLNMMDCCKPFVGDIGPTPRFGHKCSFNTTFGSNGSPPCHCIVSGTNKNYCSMDIYLLNEKEINEGFRWVYAQKNMHNSQKIDGSDEVFETAKKTIIHFKKKLEEAIKENIAANKVYSELFQIKSRYDKSLEEEDLSRTEKKSEIEMKKIAIEKDKRKIIGDSRELKDYHNVLNSYCLSLRDKYKITIDFITEFLKDIFEMDKLFEKINNMDKESIEGKEIKMKLFNCVDLDSLTVKRRNYKEKLEKFLKESKSYSLFEKSLYDQIQTKQKDQKAKFKNMYFIVDDKEPFEFKEEDENEKDLSDAII